MEWLRAVIYGFVTGLTEFVPVSSAAHGAIVLKILGAEANQALLSLFVHIGILISVLVICRPRFRGGSHRPRRKGSRQDRQGDFLTMRLLRTAVVPMVICFLFTEKASVFSGKLNFVALFLFLNGILLFLPDHFPTGNKDARSVSRFHGMLLGLGAGSSVLPGISGIGAVTSIGSLLGLNRQFTLNFAFLLAVPALLLEIAGDIYTMVASGVGGLGLLLLIRCLIAAGIAGAGSFCGITLMRFLSVKAGYCGFSYYCWGAALFSFILFMTI